MNLVWKNIARMCVKSTNAEINFLPEIRQNILDLAHATLKDTTIVCA